MNTLQTPSPMSLYEERRNDIEVANTGTMAELDSILESNLPPEEDVLEPQPLPGTMGESPAPDAGAAPPTDSGLEELDTLLEAVNTPPLEPPPVNDYGPIEQPANYGDPSPAAMAEAEGKGAFGHIMDAASFVFKPLSALGAGLAPLAHDYESETFIGKAGEAMGVAGDEFMARMFPTYGVEGEAHGEKIIENMMPNAPQAVKDISATTLELITDPTIAIGLPAAKVVQKGLRVGRETAVARGEKPFRGIYTEGIHELLTAGKGADVQDLENIGALAAKADAGDKEAIKELHTVLDSNTAIKDAVEQADDKDVLDMISQYKEKFGGSMGGPDIVPREGSLPSEFVGETLTTNNQTKALNLNLTKINSEKDVDQVLINATEYYKDDFVEGLAKQTNPETAALSQNVQLEELLGRKVQDFAPEEAYGLRQLMVSSAEQLKALAIKADLAGEGSLDRLAFEKSLAVHLAIQAKATGVTAHAGRLLQSFNMAAKSNREMIRQVGEMTAGLGEDAFTKSVFRKLVAAADDPQALNRLVNKGITAKTGDALYEVFVNSILSGPVTHAVNITSNASLVALSPTQSFMEGMSAGARLDFKNARSNFSEAIAKTQGIAEGISDVFKLATGRETIASVGLPEDVVRMHELAKQQMRPAITGQNLGASGKLGSFIDYAGSVIRLPGNALLAEDLAFKAIHNRMEINSQAATKAMTAKSGGATTSEARMVYNTLRGNPDATMKSKAIDMSQYYTFTNDLGTTGTKFQQAVNATPFKILMPFFKTPTNIVKMGLRSSAWGNLVYDLKPALTDFTAKGDVARAKIALGTGASMAIINSLDDNITGYIDESTPSGRFKAENAPPYSIKIGDKWHSYEKMEPLRSILGLHVNYMEAFSNIEDIDPETGEETNMAAELFSAVAMPMIQTVTENYMMPFIGEIVRMADGVKSGNTDYAGKKFQQLAASMIVPNGVRQINSAFFDTTIRKGEGIIQGIMKGIPGLSNQLPAVQTIWGDDQLVSDGLLIGRMSPIKTATVDTDDIDRDIIATGASIPTQPKKITISGIELDLDPFQQERFNKIRGKGVDDGPSLKEVMGFMFSDPGFRALPVEIRKERYEYIFNQSTDSAKKLLFAEDRMLQFQFDNRRQYKESKRRAQ